MHLRSSRSRSSRAALVALAAACAFADCRKHEAGAAADGAAPVERAAGPSRPSVVEAGTPVAAPPAGPARFIVLTTIVATSPAVETLRVGSDGTFEWVGEGGSRRGAVPGADVGELFGWVDGPVWRKLSEKRPAEQPGPTTFLIEAAGRRLERTQPVPYDDLFYSALQQLLDLREVATLVDRADGIGPVCRFRQTGGIAGVNRDVLVWADGTVQGAGSGTGMPGGERVPVDAGAVADLQRLLSGREWRALPARGGPVAQDAFVFTVLTPKKQVRWSEPATGALYARALELLRPMVEAGGGQ